MVYMSQERCISESHNNRINSEWQFRCAPLTACYAERYVANILIKIFQIFNN